MFFGVFWGWGGFIPILIILATMNEHCLNESHDIELDASRVSVVGGVSYAPIKRIMLSDSDKGSCVAKKVKQSVLCFLKTMEGECFTDRTYGIPWFDKVLGTPVAFLDAVQAIFREKIEQLEDVEKVVSVDLKSDGRNLTGSVRVQSKNGETITETF